MMKIFAVALFAMFACRCGKRAAVAPSRCPAPITPTCRHTIPYADLPSSDPACISAASAVVWLSGPSAVLTSYRLRLTGAPSWRAGPCMFQKL